MISGIYPRLAGEPGHLKASRGPRELAAGRQPPLGSNNAGWPARKRAIEAVVGLARRLQLARSRDYRLSAFAPLPCRAPSSRTPAAPASVAPMHVHQSTRRTLDRPTMELELVRLLSEVKATHVR